MGGRAREATEKIRALRIIVGQSAGWNLTWEVALAAEVVAEVSVQRPLSDDELRAAHADATEAEPCSDGKKVPQGVRTTWGGRVVGGRRRAQNCRISPRAWCVIAHERWCLREHGTYLDYTILVHTTRTDGVDVNQLTGAVLAWSLHHPDLELVRIFVEPIQLGPRHGVILHADQAARLQKTQTEKNNESFYRSLVSDEFFLSTISKKIKNNRPTR